MIRQKIQDPNGIHLDIIETVEKKAVRDGMKRPMGLLNLYKRIPSSCLAIPARPALCRIRPPSGSCPENHTFQPFRGPSSKS
jgi:hypothetical protein